MNESIRKQILAEPIRVDREKHITRLSWRDLEIRVKKAPSRAVTGDRWVAETGAGGSVMTVCSLDSRSAATKEATSFLKRKREDHAQRVASITPGPTA